MELENSFHVPVPVEEAWPVLLDVERIAPCMPGATLGEINGDKFDGKVKVKVGPIVVTYNGTAEFLEKDEAEHKVVISASGKEMRGAGTAKATVTAQLVAVGDETDVKVVTDLAITGKPAQFGRGVMADVSNAIIGQFAKCLVNKMSSASDSEAPAAGSADGPKAAADKASSGVFAGGGGTTPAAAAEAETAAAGAGASRTTPPTRGADDAPEVLDLLGSVRGPVMKRLAPAVGAVLALVALVLRRRRHRS